uniref:SAM-dependent methyltransferase n=1 Tax=uncultured Spirochaetaceae bacterium TaxID=201186 RepID=A0A650EPJ2_9SPIO|nr:SAM-dependent methyltransferase [uncultured Spirochaetaceae bacterium]
MIIFATLSKPTAKAEEIFGRKYERVKIKLNPSIFSEEISPNEISQEKITRDKKIYFAEFFTATQTFHKNFSSQEAENFLQENIGKMFRNCTERTENEEIVFMTSKKGKITRIAKSLKNESTKKIVSEKNFNAEKKFGVKISLGQKNSLGVNLQNRKKNYIIQEGERVPFLQELGVMTADGKIVASKYAKFRQINRFLELLDDIVPVVLERKKLEMKIANENSRENFEEKNSRNEIANEISKDEIRREEKIVASEKSASSSLTSQIEPIRILDFGSGKSYLTFAVHHYFSRKKIPFEITGVDLKKDVIEHCADLSRRLGLQNIHFFCGNIADFSGEKNPDIVITLHACDTATDFALDYAVRRGAKAILSVPCCQHEINFQLQKKSCQQKIVQPLLKYGIVRERFAALVTDCVRAEILEQAGYAVQILEFIDMEGTPKNLLIRAVLKNHAEKASQDENARSVQKSYLELLDALGVEQTLCRLLQKK